jgi:hypothetical protein
MPMAVVASARRHDEITLPEAGLPYNVWWHPGVPRIGEIAVARTSNESTVARWIEPTHRFTVGNDRGRRSLWLITAAPPATAMATMTAAIAVVSLVVGPPLVPVEMLSTAAVMFVPVVRGGGCRLRTGFRV